MQGFINGVLSFLIGACVLSFIFTLEKMIAGYPIVLKGYVVSVLVGGSAGLILRIWRLKVKEEGQKLEHLNLVLRTIRNVDELIVQEKDLNRLIQRICDNLIENRGYHNAWIAVLDESGKLIASTEAGIGEGYQSIVEYLTRGDLPDCTRKALSQPGVVITEDPASACTDCPLSEGYAGRGAISVRLEHEGKVFGIVTLSVPKEVTPDKKEQELVQEIANDIGFGLDKIEKEKKRKQSEEAFLESERRFRNLVENSLTGISIVQADRIVYQNPEQERLLGPLPRPIKFTDTESIHPDDIAKVDAFYQSIRVEELPIGAMEFRFYSPGEKANRVKMKWVHCQASRIEYQGKDAILVNMMDMTKAKDLEHLLTIQDKMASLGRVAAGIAHEIRNPLSGINIYLNTLKKLHHQDGSEEKVEKILKNIQSASIRIESVIRRVMDFAKPSEPKLTLIDINEPLTDAINLTAVTMRKSGINIETFLSNELPRSYADKNLIEEMVLNLLNNAAEAMKTMEAGKNIAVASFVEDDHIIIQVSDSGPGVPQEIIDKIFDPYFTT
ncbi:MAG: GAF domain-containing protein, partial [Desulfobacterales bacterium]|nr:GAF domain-containing protein [Desulfobacterales bacterium]